MAIVVTSGCVGVGGVAVVVACSGDTRRVVLGSKVAVGIADVASVVDELIGISLDATGALTIPPLICGTTTHDTATVFNIIVNTETVTGILTCISIIAVN